MYMYGLGWLESLIGRKYWFLVLLDVILNFDFNVTAYAWVLEVLCWGDVCDGEGGILECMVNVGELIYFLLNWWYVMVNLDESVFISFFVNLV